MAVGQKSFTWKSTTLFATLKNFDERANKVVGAAFDYQATRSETFMKVNAPWTDQTTNARNGLFTAVQHEGYTHKMLLSHGVPYGLWLELRFSGRYGIVLKTWLSTTVDLKNLLTKVFARMEEVA